MRLRQATQSTDELDLREAADDVRVAQADYEAAKQRLAALQAAREGSDRIAFLEAVAAIPDAQREAAHAEAVLAIARRHQAEVDGRRRAAAIERHRPLVRGAAADLAEHARNAINAYERFVIEVVQAREDVGDSSFTLDIGSSAYSLLATHVARLEQEFGSL